MSSIIKQAIHLSAEVPSEMGGQRLDQVAAQLFAEHSRSRLSAWIKEGLLTVDDQVVRPRDIVHGGSVLVLNAEQEAQGEWVAEDIPLDIVYEDEHILVINKPAGLVVHPAAGHASGTLLNALLHHVPDIVNVPRAGIVHRLDKDTTGLMVVAKTIQAQTQLVDQLQKRTVSRIYECIVIGVITAGGTINAPIGRSSAQRQRMAVTDGGKPATSHYRVLERFRSHTHTRVKLETGRTHQIRVHMSHVGYPLVGDPVYAGRFRIPPAASPTLVQSLKEFPRQALHARFLELDHPETGKRMKWESPLPDDLVWLLTLLRQDREAFIG
ncbi:MULTISPECIES: 23S rRNA pseudouridine(1911/1915/1917) synthase RluD [Pseudomonas]|jgi:23S rRNA pseudouridine1911/1915/1917 synthase|nr:MULTISPECIES: 23S rRNA pseudouridine(1911/1915/1917) synthase RluD [Pseudomonas]MBQ56815.1 23S rRNA pseudouridine(1911/1915/1917) synthase RluD [Pseudomonadaceae bacterium]NRH27213.1 23S rRNA pseudouridine(1911/1915/1917) synthase RluD [Pseudomonas sp. MS19]OEO27156.1 RNA pseudouridine synthase [Pseudomonas sp. J237]HCP53327.1 23S rRNA pseudouridine(1911/1915/1917) synthase RluD [Pseudomonas sp.]